MRRLLMITFLCMAAVGLLCTSASSTGQSPRIGIRGGIGTDVNLGLAYGAGANFLLDARGNAIELGILLFGGSFEETSDNGYNRYDETTDILVFGVMANYLINYTPGESGLFFVAGMGLGSISVSWEERSATDTSLGTRLPGGGSMQSVDGSTAGTIFNLGVGGSFKNGIDIRAEIPVILAFGTTGDASSVIPTAIATIGYRF
jgi:hypothetical protein